MSFGIKGDLDQIISSFVSQPRTPANSVEIRKRDEKHRREELENDAKELDSELKKGICRWVKWVVSIYLIFIAIILGSIVFYSKRELSDAVLIALLTTTTVNILGLPLMIILSLFPNKKKLQE